MEEIGVYIQVPNVVTSTSTSTSKATQKKSSVCHVPKKSSNTNDFDFRYPYMDAVDFMFLVWLGLYLITCILSKFMSSGVTSFTPLHLLWGQSPNGSKTIYHYVYWRHGSTFGEFIRSEQMYLRVYRIHLQHTFASSFDIILMFWLLFVTHKLALSIIATHGNCWIVVPNIVHLHQDVTSFQLVKGLYSFTP